MNELKMVIAVRRDLKLKKGKMAGQVAHAATALAMDPMNEDLFKRWFIGGEQRKVVVYIDTEEDLFALRDKAHYNHIDTEIIRDKGLTQLAPNTVTCIGLGPATDEELKDLTGELKLV